MKYIPGAASPAWDATGRQGKLRVNEPDTVTILLNQAAAGNHTARDELFRRIQHELRAIAEYQMRGERPDHSLQATVLINDTFMRLVGKDTDVDWEDRRHFFRSAAKAMRRLLIDHERQRRTQRRGGGEHHRVDVDLDTLSDSDTKLDLLALDEALTKLATVDPRQSDIVELHHFGGCSLKETANLVGTSVGSVKADWRMAKAWLHRELTREA